MKKGIIGVIVVVCLGGLLCVFWMNKPGYCNGIYVQFELDTSAEDERSIIEQYVEQYNAEIHYDVPHHYTFVFQNMSERKLKEILHDLLNTECVHFAMCVRVTEIFNS